MRSFRLAFCFSICAILVFARSRALPLKSEEHYDNLFQHLSKCWLRENRECGTTNQSEWHALHPNLLLRGLAT